MSCVVVPVSDWLSVTVSRAVYDPACEYVNEGVALVESVEPLSVKSHAYVSGPCSGSEERVPSNPTVSGAGPEVGVVVVMTAVGAWPCDCVLRIRRMVPPLRST